MRCSKMQSNFVLRIAIKFTVMLIWLQGGIYYLLTAHSEQRVPDPNSQRVWDNEMLWAKSLICMLYVSAQISPKLLP